MFDELQRLRDSETLVHLLSHYARLAEPNRDNWQDRVGYLEGVEPKELTRLHGELIAFQWLEQNTGITPLLQPGVVARCYRITPAGLRALQTYALDPSAN